MGIKDDIMAGPLPPDLLPAVYLAGPAEANRIPERLLLTGSVPTWNTATRKLTALVNLFEEEGESHKAINYDMFTEAWAGAAWNELYQIDRKACEWADQTLLCTFTGSYYLDRDAEIFIPPVSFFERLQAAKAARQQALSRALSEVPRWQSIRVIGSGPRAYPIVFLGLYLSTPIEPALLKSVVEAHIRNSPVATTAAHQLENTITTKPNPTPQSQLIHALGQRVPGLKSNQGLRDEPWPIRATAAVLHGGQWRSYRFGQSI